MHFYCCGPHVSYLEVWTTITNNTEQSSIKENYLCSFKLWGIFSNLKLFLFFGCKQAIGNLSSNLILSMDSHSSVLQVLKSWLGYIGIFYILVLQTRFFVNILLSQALLKHLAKVYFIKGTIQILRNQEGWVGGVSQMITL